MTLTNTILIVVGIVVIVIGLAAFINPNFSRLINAPGSPRLKGTIAFVVGAIILVIGLFFQLSG